MTLEYTILAIDEGKQQLSLIDTASSRFVWTIDLAGHPAARDLQRLDGDHALVGYEHGFFELEIATGRIVRTCARWRDVTGARRLPDGSTLVTGFNLDGCGGVNVLTLDSDWQVVRCASRDGDYVRLMRPTADGTYLLCMNGYILETRPDLAEVRRFAAPGFEHAWKAVRRDDGSTLVSAGYGAFMALFDRGGECIRRFGAAHELPAEVAPFFYASFEERPDGRLLVANWQGHGPDNGAKGCQLLEFDADFALLGTWSAPASISSLQGILVL